MSRPQPRDRFDLVDLMECLTAIGFGFVFVLALAIVCLS